MICLSLCEKHCPSASGGCAVWPLTLPGVRELLSPPAPCKGHGLHVSLSLTQLLLTGAGERVTVTRLSNYTTNKHRVHWATFAPVARKRQPGKGTLQLNSLLYPEMNWEPERGGTERPWL